MSKPRTGLVVANGDDDLSVFESDKGLAKQEVMQVKEILADMKTDFAETTKDIAQTLSDARAGEARQRRETTVVREYHKNGVPAKDTVSIVESIEFGKEA